MMTVGMAGMVRRVRLAGLCSQVSAKAAEAMLENEKRQKGFPRIKTKNKTDKSHQFFFFDSAVILFKYFLFVT